MANTSTNIYDDWDFLTAQETEASASGSEKEVELKA